MNQKTNQKTAEREDPKELTKAPEGARPSNGPRPAEREDDRKREYAGEAETVRVKISKDTSVLSKRVYAHEIVVLQMLFGEESVELVEGSEMQEPVGTATEEYDRMLRVYGKKGAQAVRQVYPSAGALASEAGLKRATAKATKPGMELKEQSKQRGKGVK